ncbi:MAG: radical SAM family heme chaperone HemW [Clostridiales bacterium]|nr:radical SAM family heme chaperone HemW [Clostridiales bacterium]
MKELSLYIHIPFCESKCHYCNFVSVKGKNSEKEKYISALIKEIELNKNNTDIVKTIFIGGGTPSSLNDGDILKISNAIYDNFIVNENVEFSIEVNPNSFTLNKAKEYKKAKVNRISFGLQSGSDKILKSINRIHNKNDFINSIKIAKQEGFTNLNTDILIGLPSQKLKDVKSTLKLLLKLKIPHISCYSLILEENTPLYKLINSKKLKLPSEETTLKMYDFVVKKLNKNKIFRYEVSNFAKLNSECKHNLTYWNLKNYLGLGLNSHSKIDDVRLENYSDFASYYNSLENNKKPIKEVIKLSKQDNKEEYVMLKLRTREGINLSEYKTLFNENLEIVKAKEINFLLKNGFVKITNSHLSATNLGFSVLNSIIIKLI